VCTAAAVAHASAAEDLPDEQCDNACTKYVAQMNKDQAKMGITNTGVKQTTTAQLIIARCSYTHNKPRKQP
jgi:hypothetical protein